MNVLVFIPTLWRFLRSGKTTRAARGPSVLKFFEEHQKDFFGPLATESGLLFYFLRAHRKRAETGQQREKGKQATP